MPNGGDKNWVRLSITLEGFRLRYGRWPSRVRLHRGMLIDLREHVFLPTEFARLEAKLGFQADDRMGMVAEDDTGAQYPYGTDDKLDELPDVRAYEWLGNPVFNPDLKW